VSRLIQLTTGAYAVALAALGALHVIFGERLARMMPAWPEHLPGRPLWAHAMGAAIALLALALLERRRPHTFALALVIVLLVPVLGMHLPRALASGHFGDAWLNVLKWLAMACSPLVVVSLVAVEERVTWRDRVISAGAHAAPWLLGAFMIGSAILHVRFAEVVSNLMQPWMPWRLFWTYFAAAALTAGGIGLVVPRTARLAALLTGVMILSWFFLVHTPRMLLDPAGPNGWSEMAESLAFSATAFLLAARAGARAENRHEDGARAALVAANSAPG
jgi:uncharacterized membrane protein